MPLLGLEPTTAVYVRAKTVHALDRAATVIGDTSVKSETLNDEGSYLNLFTDV
jgi:hypothetical protein